MMSFDEIEILFKILDDDKVIHFLLKHHINRLVEVSSIDGLFMWDATPQGHAYWSKIFEVYNETSNRH